MKKKEINKIEEEIEQKTKLTDEVKNKIIKNILGNFWLGIVIVSYFLYYVVGSNLVETNLFILTCKIFSMVLLILSIVLLELGYKKDNGYIAMNAIEILILAITTLFIPYNFFEKNLIQRNYNKLIGIYFVGYYLIKAIGIYNYEKRIFIKQESDIKEIIEKNDMDLIKKEKERRKKEKGKNKETAKPTPKAKENKVKEKTMKSKENKIEEKIIKPKVKKDKTEEKITKKENKDEKAKKTNQKVPKTEVKEIPKKRGRPRKEKT